MKDPVTYFFYDLNFKQKATLFKKLLYLFLLTKCAYWLIDYNLLFGANSVVSTKEFDIGLFKGMAFFLYKHIHLCFCAIILTASLSLLNLWKAKFYFITDFVIWFLVLNLNNRVYSTLTGGDYLLNQLLFFNCFVSFVFNNTNKVRDQLRILLHNFGVIAIIVQICFIYLSSGITKLTNEAWTSGQAVSIISHTDHYNLYSAIRFAKDSGIAMLLTYIVLFYQLLFPFLVWFKRIKLPLLVLGIIIHLCIVLIIGLVGFGILMLIPYVLFWPAKELKH